MVLFSPFNSPLDSSSETSSISSRIKGLTSGSGIVKNISGKKQNLIRKEKIKKIDFPSGYKNGVGENKS